MGIHLEEIIFVVSPAHTAQAYIIGCLSILHTERELSLQQSILRTPVNLVLYVNTLRQTALVEMYALQNVRVAISFPDDQRLSQGAFFDRYLHAVVNRQRSLVERCLLNLPGRPVLRPAVIEDNQPQTLSCCDQLSVGLLVDKRYDIAMTVDSQRIARRLYLPFRYFRADRPGRGRRLQAVNGKARRGHFRIEEQPVPSFLPHHLRCHTLAVGTRHLIVP